MRRTHRRTPTDWDAEHILLRTVRCVSGTVELVMNCEPSFDYHRTSASWEYSAQAYGEAIARATKNPDSHPTLRLTTNLRIGLEGREARARTRLKEGDKVFVALSWSGHPAPQTFDEAADKIVADYSAGMTKKIGLACALIHAPRVWARGSSSRRCPNCSRRSTPEPCDALTGASRHARDCMGTHR